MTTADRLLAGFTAMCLAAAFGVIGAVHNDRIHGLQRSVDRQRISVEQLRSEIAAARADARRAQQTAEHAAAGAHQARVAAARASRSQQRTPLPAAVPPAPAGATAWAATATARAVAQCESGGDPTVVATHSGVTYYGKWQADAAFVAAYDGSSAWSWVRNGRFTMPEAQQDAMAYRGYLARGWQPWACAT